MQNLKIFVVGDGAVGKTSLLITFSTGNYPSDYVPYVFDKSETPSCMVEGVSYELDLWDSPGQPDYDRLRPLHYPQTDVFLVCFDVARRSSFLNVKEKWVPEMRHHMPETPILLVATKIDLRSQVHAEELVTAQEAKQLARELVLKYVECSALTQEGVKNVFETAIRGTLCHPPRKQKTGLGSRLFSFVLGSKLSKAK